MNANPAHDRPRTLIEPAVHKASTVTQRQTVTQPRSVTPEPLRPAAGLVLGILLSVMLWLAALVAWLVL